MRQPTPKVYKYKQVEAILTVGIDINGRIFSLIEKNGQVVAKDIYIKFPSEVSLIERGWTRYYE